MFPGPNNIGPGNTLERFVARMSRPFPSIPFDEKPSKPRDREITMLVDFGIPLGATRDLLELASDAIDLAKVAVGTAALYPPDVLTKKLAAYQGAGVTPFPGGQFLEYAIHIGKVESYFDDARAAGFPAIEVSDNLLDIAPEAKHEIIRSAVRDHGFRVLGEVGSKDATNDSADLIADAAGCLAAGAWKVLVEAAEFFEGGRFRESFADEILAQLDPADLIFELPGSWIPGIAASDVHAMQVWLLERVGVDANVGNVAPSDIVSFEALRRNLGVKMRFD